MAGKEKKVQHNQIFLGEPVQKRQLFIMDLPLFVFDVITDFLAKRVYLLVSFYYFEF